LTRRLSSSGCSIFKLNFNRKRKRRNESEIVHILEFTSLNLPFKRQRHKLKPKKCELNACVRDLSKKLNRRNK
jgi:hypothetical protein